MVAQLLPEMCDAGLVATTEPNALRDAVDAPGWVAKLLGLPAGGVPGLASAAVSSASSALSSSQQQARLPAPLLQGSLNNGGPAIPWRRANVRHTSNELYVDAVETLHVLLAPGGLPLRAVAHGALVFTAKVSGVPELLLSLSVPRGGAAAALRLPVFHPCVRLARWRERPGELSFVPPDGRFVLMAYEADLLAAGRRKGAGLALPASVAVIVAAPAFTVHLTLHPLPLLAPPQPAGFSSAAAAGIASSPSASSTGSGAASGTSAAPSLSDVVVRVRIPPGVRSLGHRRPPRGTAGWAPGDEELEWRVGSRDAAALCSPGRGAAARGRRRRVWGPEVRGRRQRGRAGAAVAGAARRGGAGGEVGVRRRRGRRGGEGRGARVRRRRRGGRVGGSDADGGERRLHGQGVAGQRRARGEAGGGRGAVAGAGRRGAAVQGRQVHDGEQGRR